MRQFLLFLNIILLGAVGYLYYLHFSRIEKPGKKTVAVSSYRDTLHTGAGSIAYIEIDSVNEKVSHIRNLRKELENEQRAIEKEWENGYRSLQAQKDEFLKRGSAITEDMAREFQGKLLQQQDQIDSRKQELNQKLSEKSYKLMDELTAEMKKFLNEYNKEHNFSYIFTTGSGLEFLAYKDSAYDITGDVIDGMNERLGKDKKP